MRLIDADALKEMLIKERDAIPLTKTERYGFGVEFPDPHGTAMRGGINKAFRCMEQTPTIDAVPVDAVAQMLFDLFGDGCPCNYNDIAEWLAGSNGCTENCNKNEDPLLCWKLFIKHYGERRSDEA